MAEEESKNVWNFQIDKLKPYNSRWYAPPRNIIYIKKENVEEIEDTLFRNEDYKEQCLEFANEALHRLRTREGNIFRLVKPGLVEGALISGGCIFHVNFKVKRVDDPDKPSQMLFAQIRLIGDSPTDLRAIVDICVSLGPVHKLRAEVYEGGCQFCTSFIYHPIGGRKKILRGLVNDEVSWLHRKPKRGHRCPNWFKYLERLRDSGSCSGSSSCSNASDGDIRVVPEFRA